MIRMHDETYMPRVFWSPGYPCCCGPPVCGFCQSPTPPSLLARFAGVSSDACGDCANYNTTDFELDYIALCSWIGQPLCNDTMLDLQLVFEDAMHARWQLAVRDASFSAVALFTQSVDITGGPIDCTAHYTLTRVFGLTTGECNWSAASAEINP